MIILDSSAIVAIWKKEAPAEALKLRLSEEKRADRRISAATYLEAGAVLAGTMPRDPAVAIGRFDQWLAESLIEIVPVDERQARVALEAHVRFGRGFGSGAKLNFGDCFSYALAKTLKAPLLYVGDDFDKTDARSALGRKKDAKGRTQ